MRRLVVLLGISVVLVGFAAMFAGAQRERRAYGDGKPAALIEPSPFARLVEGGAVAAPPANPKVEKYLQLLSRKAQRLNDEELDKAIDELTRTLDDQDAAAQAELDTIVESLNALIQRYPGTPAANRVKAAVGILQQGEPAQQFPAPEAPALNRSS